MRLLEPAVGLARNQQRGRLRAWRPIRCRCRRCCRRSRREAAPRRTPVDRVDLPVRAPEDRPAAEPEPPEGPPAARGAAGRWSFARSSQPVAQIESRSARESRASRSPAGARDAVQRFRRPGRTSPGAPRSSGSSKPNRLITPSTSTASTGPVVDPRPRARGPQRSSATPGSSGTDASVAQRLSRSKTTGVRLVTRRRRPCVARRGRPATIRRRAEHQPAHPQGPTPPEEEDRDAGPQVRARAASGASPPRSAAASARASTPRRPKKPNSALRKVARVRLTNGDGGHRATSRARATTSRSTPSCSCEAAASRTSRACATRSSAGRSTPPASRTASSRARSTESSSQLVPASQRRTAIRPRRAGLPATARKLVQQVVNKVMTDGKKSLAERITYDALALVGERTGRHAGGRARGRDQGADPGARGPLAPRRRRHLPGARRGAGTPRPHARRALARPVRPRPPREVDARAPRRPRSSDATTQQGNAWKRKDDIYRMAQANKAFAHYRW